MGGLLRGIALSIVLYCVVTGLLCFTVFLCGGDLFKIPGYWFIGIGVFTGILAGIIYENLD
jgi:hypothetical protein